MALLFNAACFILILTVVKAQAQTPVQSHAASTPPVGNSVDQVNITSLNQSSQNVANRANETSNITTTITNTVNSTSSPPLPAVVDDGVADNLADYVIKKVGQLISGNDKPGTTQAPLQNPITSETEADLRNCSKPDTLDRFTSGQIPADVQDFLKNDLSVHGLMSALLKPEVVETLQTKCHSGKWCLNDSYHQAIIDGKKSFYADSPFCSDAMWSSLQNMLDLRYECKEKRLSFLVNTVLLLCDLESVGNLTPECYARTVEALYVTYADLTIANGTKQSQLEEKDCNDFRVQMTKTYLCADDVCSFDQNILLEKFEMWVGLAQNSVDVAAMCSIQDACEATKKVDGTTPFYQYNDLTTLSPDLYDQELKEMEEEIEQALKNAEQETEDISSIGTGIQDQGVNADAADDYEEDNAMLFGLITMTTVVTLGMLSIALVAYRRYKCSRMASYRRGYSQLSEEESRMLKNDYN